MFDKGSRIEYQYGLEDRSPYYYTDINPNYGLALKTNTLIMQYAGDSGSYYFGGNPYVLDEECTGMVWLVPSAPSASAMEVALR